MGKVALIIGAKEIEATISLAGTGSAVFSPGWLNTPSRQNKGPPSTPEPNPETDPAELSLHKGAIF